MRVKSKWEEKELIKEREMKGRGKRYMKTRSDI